MNDSSEQSDAIPEATLEQIGHYDEEFSAFVQERMDKGSEEYGPFAFLENDMFTFLIEELADAVNYCRMMYVKLRLAQEAFNARGIDIAAFTFDEGKLPDTLSSDTPSFVPRSEVSGFLPKDETEG